MDIQEVLELHKKWLNNEKGGERANLSDANLSGADLRRADLRRAGLRRANLINANLSGAEFSGADIDFSSYPISCGGMHWHIDDKQGIQFLYHAISNILYSKNTSDELKKSVSALVDVCNKFHRVDECGLLKGVK